MYPIIFDFGRFSLHTYGLAMAIAFGAGIYLAMKRADKCEMGSKFALDLSYLILVFSLVGARFTYVITIGVNLRIILGYHFTDSAYRTNRDCRTGTLGGSHRRFCHCIYLLPQKGSCILGGDGSLYSFFDLRNCRGEIRLFL